MDVKRAADLYAQGWSLRQIGADWAFPGPRWAINFAAPASRCVAQVLPHIKSAADHATSLEDALAELHRLERRLDRRLRRDQERREGPSR